MNKSELVNYIRDETGLKKSDAAAALNAVIDGISGALQEADSVALPGFGTFTVRERAAYKGRHPQTGETIDIAASKNAVFKAGKALKDSLN